MFRLSIQNTVLRYYLMMAVVIVTVYSHQMWLVFVAMAIAVSAILGIRVGGGPKQENKAVPMKAAPRKVQSHKDMRPAA